MPAGSSPSLAGTAGPHVFVADLDRPVLDRDDHHHLTRVLRIRAGDPLTASDGCGNWCEARLGADLELTVVGPVQHVPADGRPTTIAFSLVKGQKPELVVQKLTELGVDTVVALRAERSIVRWSADKEGHQLERWRRIAREAAMQSHRVRVPEIRGVIDAGEWLAQPEVAVAHFGGPRLDRSHRSIAIGPEGGWTADELAFAGPRTVSLGPTVLRAETAAIAAGVLLSAASTAAKPDGL